MGKSTRPPLPDWNPAGPKGKIRPRTFDEKLDDRIREIDESKTKQKEWEAESERIRKAEEARQKAHETEWMQRRAKCAGSLEILSDEIKIRKNNWQNVAIDVSMAYAAAFESFSKSLSDESTHSQAAWSKAFTALSSCVGGGIAVLVKKQGEKWAKDEAQKLFVDTAKKAVEAGVNGLFSVTAPLLATKYEATSIPAPAKLQSELTKLLNNLETDMVEWCKAHKEEINNMGLWLFEDYEPRKLDEEIAKFLHDKDSQFNSQPFLLEIRKADLQTELEKMMVGPWAVAFCEREIGRRSWAPRKGLPRRVIDKLVEFDFVSDTGHYSDADVLRIAQWGPNTERTMRRTVEKIKSYRSKKFG